MNILVKPLISKLKADILTYPELSSYEDYLRREKNQIVIFIGFCSFLIITLLVAMVSLSDNPGVFLAFGFWIGFFLKSVVELILTLKSSVVKSEVWAYYETTRQKERVEENYQVILNEYKSNPKKFCRNYLNKSGSGFLNFFKERAVIEGELNPDFIFYAVSIPKVKDLSIDSLRKILLAYQPLNLNAPLDLETKFQNYSFRDIERIFTTPFNRAFLLKLPSGILPVEKSFLSLEDALTEKDVPPKFKTIHNKIISNFHFKVLLSKKDYEEAGINFINCLKNYFDHSVVVLTVHVGTKPLACISLKDGKIQEIKGVNNQECKEREGIINILREKSFI